MKIIIIGFAVLLTTTAIGFAHGGGTDDCGCHYNRDTLEYHCHKRKKVGGGCPPLAYEPNTEDIFNIRYERLTK
jgi:hypothetical protein